MKYFYFFPIFPRLVQLFFVTLHRLLKIAFFLTIFLSLKLPHEGQKNIITLAVCGFIYLGQGCGKPQRQIKVKSAIFCTQKHKKIKKYATNEAKKPQG